jgi:hypothetical protein
MKIVINNVSIEFDLACRILKTKGGDCPFDEVQDFWEEILPLNFKEIAQLPNLEQRRIALLFLGLDRMVAEVNPILVSSVTIPKQTTWVMESGEVVDFKFEDTYELYKVNGDYFNEGVNNWQKMADAYYVKCKDTSTDREYLIWVDLNSVWNVKCENDKKLNRWEFDVNKINAIDCIAWTIQTDIPQGNIEKIVRQGDCIMIKPKGKYKTLDKERHLSKEEYLELLVAES